MGYRRHACMHRRRQASALAVRIVVILTLFLIATPSINSAYSSLQTEVSIPNTATIQYDGFQSAIFFEYGAESGDFSGWDDYYPYSRTKPSITIVSTEQARSGMKSVKFSMVGGIKTDDQRRLGLFIHDDTGPFMKTGFYYSFWMYVPLNIEDMIEHDPNALFNIGGLKWYFNELQWQYGARWRLYWSTTYQKVRAKIRIVAWDSTGGTSPSSTVYEGTTYYFYHGDTSNVIWSHDVNYGAWNHFQIYLKSVTDNMGVWQAWVNDDLLGTISGEATHPDAYLTPDPPASFYTQNNKYPHPQLMYYVNLDAPAGYLYADDVVIATEKVPENYVIVKELGG